LNYHTPDFLKRRWSDLNVVEDMPEGVTTTVYHIGIGEDDEEICAFAYRSSNDFESEELPHAMRAKPSMHFCIFR